MPQKTFVYGKFRWPARNVGLPHMDNFRAEPENAIEVLIEFDGGLALRGKLYIKAESTASWIPAQMRSVQDSRWYPTFQKSPKQVVFDMNGSGIWEVLYLRNESDEGVIYAAVGLRYAATTPAWVFMQMKQEL